MNILIFGDSITWGAGDRESSGWADRLKQDQELFNLGYEFTNLGVSGDNTYDLLERFEIEARARESEVILFSIGINDSQYVSSDQSHRVPLDQFKINLEKLYDIANKFSPNIAFLGLNGVDENKTCPIPWNQDKSYFNEAINRYDRTIRDFSDKKKLDFIDINSVLEKEDLEDGLHPNTGGHKKIHQKVKNYFLK